MISFKKEWRIDEVSELGATKFILNKYIKTYLILCDDNEKWATLKIGYVGDFDDINACLWWSIYSYRFEAFKAKGTGLFKNFIKDKFYRDSQQFLFTFHPIAARILSNVKNDKRANLYKTYSFNGYVSLPCEEGLILKRKDKACS